MAAFRLAYGIGARKSQHRRAAAGPDIPLLDATGIRLRRAPFTPDRVTAGLV